jgi:hypothetical protein
MKKRILWRLAGLGLILVSIWFIPHCGGDGGYLFISIPIGATALFGPKSMYDNI